jgi:hypothetical protein
VLAWLESPSSSYEELMTTSRFLSSNLIEEDLPQDLIRFRIVLYGLLTLQVGSTYRHHAYVVRYRYHDV